MSKAIYIGVDKVARKVKSPYLGINNISRRARSAFVGVDNVARSCFGGVAWGKYSCDKSGGYYEESGSKSATTTGSYAAGGLNLYHDFVFDSSNGFTGSNSAYIYLSNTMTADEVISAFTGKYDVGQTSAKRYDTIRDVQVNVIIWGSTRGIKFTYDYTEYSASYVPVIYSKGSTSYGTVSAEEGELPEGGTLIEGSVDEGYCIMQIGSTYFYYVLEG